MNHKTKLSCLCACILGLAGSLIAGDNPAADNSGSSSKTAAAPAPANPEIEALKKVLLEQQRQIDELRRKVSGESKPSATPAAAAAPAPVAPAPAPVMAHPSSGAVASTTPIVPPSPVAPPAPFSRRPLPPRPPLPLPRT